MTIKLLTRDVMGHPLTPTPKEIIEAMQLEYERNLCALSTADLQRRFPHRDPPLPLIEEVKSAWVSKKDLLELIEDNDGSGVRILYGAHHLNTYSEEFPFEYRGLHNVILVATKDSMDDGNPVASRAVNQLKEASTIEEANSVLTSGPFKNMGGDKIPLCPPNC